MSDVVTTRLTELEDVIQRGMDTFVEVGAALFEIRDDRLYRASHTTFEDYCQERWGMSRRHANRTIEAASVAGILGPIGPKPATESVAREIAPVLKDEGPEAVEEVWGEVVEQHGPTPTATQVREVVEERAETSVGPRKQGQQQKLVSGIAEKARHIYALEPHLDLEAISSLPEEEKHRWKQELSAARTVLSRVIGAM
jgi:hypothetical protein